MSNEPNHIFTALSVFLIDDWALLNKVKYIIKNKYFESKI